MKTMLVTGGGSGLGRAIAEAADREGYRVGVLDVAAEAASEVAGQLRNGVPLVCDVREPQQVREALAELDELDVVVNNAGILRTGPLIDHDPDDFRLVMDINLNAVFIVAQAAARRMRDGRGGSIINLASINGIHPSPNCGAYAAAKGGVMALTQHMSVEWGQYGIRVNAIAPGFVLAGMSEPFYANESVRNKRAAAVPLGRLGEAADIANAVMFLASEQAAYISGHTLTVDGGVINSVLQHLPRE
jgi:NAD(P)-dependent dehydrogenase (short-subunit alcohol dehydrogenase family)